MNYKNWERLGVIVGVISLHLISVPFWLFGGYRWGLSVNAIILLWGIVVASEIISAQSSKREG